MAIWYEDNRNESSFRTKAQKVFIFLLSAAVIGLAIFTLIYLGNFLSPKTKMELKNRQEQEEALSRAIKGTVIRSGYVRTNLGFEELYVPFITIEIINISEKPIDKILLNAFFYRNEKHICSTSLPLFNIAPNMPIKVDLKCTESTGFGIVAKGVSLAQTSKPMSYGISVISSGIRVSLSKGELDLT